MVALRKEGDHPGHWALGAGMEAASSEKQERWAGGPKIEGRGRKAIGK